MKSQEMQTGLFEDMQLIVGNALLENLVHQSKDAFQVLNLKKNEFLVKEGEVCRYFCYVESGILQHEIVINDEEITTYLALRNTFTASLNSFLFNKPSRKSI